MSDEPENLVLVYLRRIDQRLDRVETKLDIAAVNARLDNLDRRLTRIERRLDLVGQPADGEPAT